MVDANTDQELNRLYWESDASVSDIADRLDISRRALYDGIEPVPAGRPCPECGAPLGFRNRTALENREAECPECGFETELAPGEGREEPDAGATPGTGPAGAAGTPRTVSAPGASALGAAFVVGLAVGAVIAYIAQRG